MRLLEPSELDAIVEEKHYNQMFDICTAGLQKSLADFIKNIFINKVEQKRNKSSLGSFLACRLSILDNEI